MVLAAGRAPLVQAQVKRDPTLRDFLSLAGLSGGIPVSPLADAGRVPLGGPIAFTDPRPIDFPVPGSGGECRVDPTPEDGLPQPPQDDLLGDGVAFNDPAPIDFPIPGSGGQCPVGQTPEDALPQGPPPIEFPIPGSGGECPLGEGPDDFQRPRIWRTGARFDHNPDPVDAAPPDPAVQVVIATFPTLRYELRPEVIPGSLAPGGGAEAHEPDEPLHVYVTSLGRLGANGVDVTVVATGEEAVELTGGAVVLEPVVLSRAEAERLRAERQQAVNELPSGGAEATGTADAYCLDIDREPPAEGTFLRIAETGVQALYDRHRRVIDAATRLREAGRLMPDSDPESYFHSIRQWAIWTLTESLDETRFAEEFVAHARKNFEASDQTWSGEIEQAVRQLVPGRWRDVLKVLEAAATEEAEERKGGDP